MPGALLPKTEIPHSRPPRHPRLPALFCSLLGNRNTIIGTSVRPRISRHIRSGGSAMRSTRIRSGRSFASLTKASRQTLPRPPSSLRQTKLSTMFDEPVDRQRQPESWQMSLIVSYEKSFLVSELLIRAEAMLTSLSRSSAALPIRSRARTRAAATAARVQPR